MQYVHKIFPRIIDGSFFEIVTKRPIAKHLKHRVVICVKSHFFQVVMFTAYAQAFLRVCGSFVFRRDVAQYDVLELVHSGICKHQCRIVFDDHRCRRHNLMAFAVEEIFKRFSNFFC